MIGVSEKPKEDLYELRLCSCLDSVGGLRCPTRTQRCITQCTRVNRQSKILVLQCGFTEIAWYCGELAVGNPMAILRDRSDLAKNTGIRTVKQTSALDSASNQTVTLLK